MTSRGERHDTVVLWQAAFMLDLLFREGKCLQGGSKILQWAVHVRASFGKGWQAIEGQLVNVAIIRYIAVVQVHTQRRRGRWTRGKGAKFQQESTAKAGLLCFNKKTPQAGLVNSCERGRVYSDGCVLHYLVTGSIDSTRYLWCSWQINCLHCTWWFVNWQIDWIENSVPLNSPSSALSMLPRTLSCVE